MGDLDGSSWVGSSCHAEQQRLMELRRAILLLQDRPSISFSRLYSTVIAADHSAGWKERIGMKLSFLLAAPPPFCPPRLGVSAAPKEVKNGVVRDGPRRVRLFYPCQPRTHVDLI